MVEITSQLLTDGLIGEEEMRGEKLRKRRTNMCGKVEKSGMCEGYREDFGYSKGGKVSGHTGWGKGTDGMGDLFTLANHSLKKVNYAPITQGEEVPRMTTCRRYQDKEGWKSKEKGLGSLRLANTVGWGGWDRGGWYRDKERMTCLRMTGQGITRV